MSRLLTLLTLFLVTASVAACAGTTPTPAAPPPSPAPAPTPTPPPPSGENDALPSDPTQVPAAPASCSAFAERKPGTAVACSDKKTAHTALASALASHDAGERDAALAALESCTELPAGVVRALRAELAPPECGDVLVEPWLAHPPSGLRPEVRDALFGLGFAARAARLVREPPKLGAPFTKERVQKFMAGPLKQWIEGQAKAIYSVSLHGSNLEGYGKAVVAIEAGLADLRFVNVARSAPVSDEIAKDSELKDAYYDSLEQALEPRKTRGRDAALVGLKKLAEVGVVSDARVERARKLLSELYAGRRIDALDSLLVPPLSPPAPASDDEQLAALLPTFYAESVLPDADPTRATLLRALLERGLGKAERARLGAAKNASPEVRRLYARGLFALGQRYWRSGDFATAASALSTAKLPAGEKAEAALISAVAQALAGGPKDAAEMMLTGPHLPKGVGDVAELDKLGKAKGAPAGMALFDAARLLEIARPENADTGYWNGVAERYESAAKLLTDQAQKSDAESRAKAARDTAKAIAPKPAP